MLATERFIAVAISSVRIVPEEPTRVPATIRATLSSANPAAAAERPVNAFSSEITTGMSAPPIGSTTRLPSIAGGDQDGDEQALRGIVVVRRDHDAGDDDPDQQQGVDHLLARDRERPGRDQVLELREGDVGAPEGDRADRPSRTGPGSARRAGSRGPRRAPRARGGTPTRRSARRRRRRRRCRARPSAASGSSGRGSTRRGRPPCRSTSPATISPQLPIPSSSRVVTTATAIPPAAIRLPCLAVVGWVPCERRR